MEDKSIRAKSPVFNNYIKNSLSSVGLNVGNQTLALREAKSFTGAIEELKSDPVKNPIHGMGINCHEEVYMDSKVQTPEKKGYETREVNSDQIFIVNEEMLNYRGKRYSLNDIATSWKKDCRMWLWKNKRNKSVGELCDKLQNIKLHN